MDLVNLLLCFLYIELGSDCPKKHLAVATVLQISSSLPKMAAMLPVSSPSSTSISSEMSYSRSTLSSLPFLNWQQRQRTNGLCVKNVGGLNSGLTYRDAGVDIDAGAELVQRIAKMTPGIGGFGGLFPFGK